ncbi:AAA family ATPase [Lacticaseibacillus paracasei]|uniref:AAA family ATPase n=1 Tax=Lacticaseibacillus paracasei TaxID=1597 RepID=UPI00222FD63E|nr:AAA family ATPase [Lacticaseibacillus paracasei]UZD24983.1 AAA family ATPase [Lacticaseibacillus paracasei]
MKIDVFFEPELIFSRRVNKLDGTFRFAKFLQYLEDATATKNEDESGQTKVKITFTSDISEFQNNHVCIIRISDLVGYRSFMFEKIDAHLEILEQLGVKQVIINNPTRLLMSNLEQRSDLIVHNNLPFRKISITQINSLARDFDSQIVGQDNAKTAIHRKLVVQHVRTGDKPLVLMFYGNPGIGKTEVAKVMAKSLFGTNKIIREQMSMAAGTASAEYFKATGHSENSFSKVLLNRKSNILLLDEFALAPAYIQTAFFQLFDEGKYVDENFSVDMRNSIIICTSNFTSRKQMKNTISPALYSRFDAVIPFVDFTPVEKIEVSNRIVDSYLKSGKIRSQYIKLIDVNNVKEHVHQMVQHFSSFRAIRNLVEDIIADELIENSKWKD